MRLRSVELLGGIEKKHLSQQDEIISDCCGLLVQDFNDRVGYVHFSAQEWFHHIRVEDFPDFDRHVAIACAKHLSISEIQQLVEQNTCLKSSLSGAGKPENYPLLGYAGEHQHLHRRSVRTLRDGEDKDLVEVMRELVTSEGSRTLYSRLVYSLNVYDTSSTMLDGDGKCNGYIAS
ncbi:hypothetical protein HDV57DRAFT_521117 [Trichoderma longibrachiatum]